MYDTWNPTVTGTPVQQWSNHIHESSLDQVVLLSTCHTRLCVYLVFSVVPLLAELCCHVVAELVYLISNADYTAGEKYEWNLWVLWPSNFHQWPHFSWWCAVQLIAFSLICIEVCLFFLMLFRLYSDSINVQNVDLYYINNSQVYGGLFLLNKQKPTFDTVTNLSLRKIKSATVLTRKSVDFYFACISVVILCESRRSR